MLHFFPFPEKIKIKYITPLSLYYRKYSLRSISVQFVCKGYGWAPDMGTYVWIPAANGSIPQGAVHAGKDCDGTILYAGRATHEGDILPGKVSPSHGAALVAYGGSEHHKSEYEVSNSEEEACMFMFFHFYQNLIPCV